MSIETNCKATVLAKELMDMGCDLAKESQLPADGVRLFWLRVAEMANSLTGDELMVPSTTPSSQRLEAEGLPAPPSDDEEFPFGKHKGERYGDIPDGYYGWLSRQAWIEEWPEVLSYIEANGLD